MNPLGYLIVGLISGALVVAIFFLLSRRRPAGEDLLAKIELLERAQERRERMIREEMTRSREENANAAKAQREELTGSLESVRGIVDQRLKQLQEDNSTQIERMRATVDEKLHGTLEKRLGESFKLVSDRLEQVHQGLGAMRQLATDVGGLQRVLTNVKTRGGWSEWQLGALLAEMLTPERHLR
jgi:DNA recombination protein RmuC